MDRPRHAHLARVARSLGACQLVEFELKSYMSQAFALVAKCVGTRMPFKIVGSDYEDASLERLIDTFKKLSDSPALSKRLERFKKERNFVAHKAIAMCIDPDGELDRSAARALKRRLEEIEAEASSLVGAIYSESSKFVAHLYFDVIEEEG